MATHTALRARTRALSVVGVVAMLCLSVAACGSGGSSGGTTGGPGVDLNGKTISLGVLTPLSGPVAAPIGIPLTKGMETYFKSVNAKGGIDGFKINLVEKDSKYDPATEVEQYNAIKGSVAMFAQSLGTPTTQAIAPLTHTDKILVTVAGQDSYLAREPYLILSATPYRLQVENAFDYVVNQLHEQSPKTAIIYQDDGYGQDGLTGYTEAVSAYHLNNVGEATYEATDTTAQQFAPAVLKIKASGAKYVFLTSTPIPTAYIIGTAHALGYDPHWILQSPAFATGLMATAVAPLLKAECLLMGNAGALWGDTSQLGMQQMLNDIQTYAAGQQPDYFFQAGYTLAWITAAIVKKAADNKDLSRVGFVNAFNTIGTINTGGLAPPLTYGSSPNQRVPLRDDRIYVIDPTQPGDLKPITGDFTGTAAMASQF
jgi:ABC-type branched-subunit amino acid transport system substrate-binding protein